MGGGFFALNSSSAPRESFALFDDCGSTIESPRSRLYTGHAGTLVCTHAEQLPEVLSSMHDALRGGRHAVGVFDYEPVHVPRLFQVDRYASVLQMTSTVEARLRDDATLADVFAAIYPCGSITGAQGSRSSSCA